MYSLIHSLDEEKLYWESILEPMASVANMTLCLMEDEKLEVSILFTKHQNGLSVFSSKGDINYRFELIKE